MPRRLRDIVATLVALIVLFVMLAAINPRVRETMNDLSGGTTDWNQPGQMFGNLLTAAGTVAATYAADNPFLFSFLLAAVLLFLLMLRA